MPSILRGLVVLVLGAALGFQVVRTAAMERFIPRNAIGARIWPSHPAVITDRTMAEIGALARRGQELTPATLNQVAEIVRKAPLAAEPFLIHGALAQLEGQQQRAERLFTEARLREPRSEAARYFLADRYLRTGRIDQALIEMAVFSRLVPYATGQFAPALASYARTPGAVPQIRRFFRTSPEFEPLVLAELAADARNAELILALAGPASLGRGGPAQPWQARILRTLVDQRQYGKAYAIWQRITGVRGGGLTNAGFEDLNAPPPFNWTYGTAGGVAEPAGNGRLQVIYYGREDVVLAQQLLVLAPGEYQLSMDVSGQAGDGSAVAWSLTCQPQGNRIFSLPLKQGQRQAVARFSIPQGCAAQSLQLSGTVGDFPASLDFSIGELKLARVAGR